MFILSFDVASKSLAVSLLKFNECWKQNLAINHDNFKEQCSELNAVDMCKLVLKYMDAVEDILNNMIQPIVFDVVDLIPTKKVKESTVIERASRLNGYLKLLDIYIKKSYGTCASDIKVLLEYQMGPNDQSRNVGSQILYHYSKPDLKFANSNIALKETPFSNGLSGLNYDISIIGPSLKNKINLGSLTHQHFIEKYTKTYDANKKHSVANFNHWVKTKNVAHLTTNIKKKNIDDIADSVTMTIAWLHIKSGLI